MLEKRMIDYDMAKSFLKEHLEASGRLMRRALSNKRAGTFYAYVPPETPADVKLSSGGVFSPDESDEQKRLVIHELTEIFVGHEDIAGIAQNLAFRPTDQAFKRYCPYAIDDDAVYYVSRTPSVLFELVSSYPKVILVGNPRRTIEQMNRELVAEIVDGYSFIICGAFDEEAHLIWRSSE